MTSLSFQCPLILSVNEQNMYKLKLIIIVCKHNNDDQGSSRLYVYLLGCRDVDFAVECGCIQSKGHRFGRV